MDWHALLARKFAVALKTPDAKIGDVVPYTNQYGRLGLRYTVIAEKRTFYISTSPLGQFLTREKVAKTIADPTNLDRKKTLLYRNRDMEEGLRIEARSCGFWFEVWTPTSGQPCDDYFAKFISEKEEKKFC